MTNELTRLSIRGLKMNSLLIPPKTEGWVSYNALKLLLVGAQSKKVFELQLEVMDLLRGEGKVVCNKRNESGMVVRLNAGSDTFARFLFSLSTCAIVELRRDES